MKSTKRRIDLLLVERGFVSTTAAAQALLMSGKVRVNNETTSKAGTPVAIDVEIVVAEQEPYVSRGGRKLAAAVQAFKISLTGKICADVGSSTGGFTDVLLQNGAAHVYAIDNAHGELDWKLRNDSRVSVMERTNVTTLEQLPQRVDFVSIDVSLLSLKKVLPIVKTWLAPSAQIVALIKPQYEASRDQLPKGAVIKSPEVHREILSEMMGYFSSQALQPGGLISSPILGGSGNREFLVLLSCGKTTLEASEAAALISNALDNS